MTTGALRRLRSRGNHVGTAREVAVTVNSTIDAKRALLRIALLDQLGQADNAPVSDSARARMRLDTVNEYLEGSHTLDLSAPLVTVTVPRW